MFCHKCGTPMDDNAAFCPKCGAKIIVDNNARHVAAQESPNPIQTQTPDIPLDTPKKKKFKKLPIIIGAVALAVVVIIIAGNFDDILKRGEQARKDEEYISKAATSSEQTADAELPDWKVAYASKIQELSVENNELQFALIDLTESDIPALVADYSGYSISVFTWKGESLVTLIDSPYGVGGNLGYDYLPGGNVIRNYSNDQAGAIVYENYMTVNDAHEVVDLNDEQLSIRHYKDINGNDQIDENEYIETPLYYYGEKEITEKEYTSYQIPGDYKSINGDKSFEAILSQLGVEIEAGNQLDNETLNGGEVPFGYEGEEGDYEPTQEVGFHRSDYFTGITRTDLLRYPDNYYYSRVYFSEYKVIEILEPKLHLAKYDNLVANDFDYLIIDDRLNSGANALVGDRVAVYGTFRENNTVNFNDGRSQQIPMIAADRFMVNSLLPNTEELAQALVESMNNSPFVFGNDSKYISGTTVQLVMGIYGMGKSTDISIFDGSKMSIQYQNPKFVGDVDGYTVTINPQLSPEIVSPKDAGVQLSEDELGLTPIRVNATITSIEQNQFAPYMLKLTFIIESFEPY